MATTTKLHERQISELENARQQAVEIAKTYKEEAKQTVSGLQNANDKYDRELLQHAANVKRLKDLEHQLSSVVTERDRLLVLVPEIRSSVTEKEKAWKEEKERLLESCQSAENAAKATRKCNDVLHAKLSQMSEREGKQREENVDEMIVGENQNADNDTSLRSMIDVLRRDKDMALCRLDLSNKETQRLQSKIEGLKRRLDHASLQLQAEVERNKTSEQTTEQHIQSMNQVGQLKHVRETNTLLREEIDRLTRDEMKWRQRAERLEGENQPLQEEIKKLTKEIAALRAEKESAIKESQKWSERVREILNKYKKVDPVVHEKLLVEVVELKEKITTLQTEVNPSHFFFLFSFFVFCFLLQSLFFCISDKQQKKSKQVSSLRTQNQTLTHEKQRMSSLLQTQQQQQQQLQQQQQQQLQQQQQQLEQTQQQLQQEKNNLNEQDKRLATSNKTIVQLKSQLTKEREARTSVTGARRMLPPRAVSCCFLCVFSLSQILFSLLMCCVCFVVICLTLFLFLSLFFLWV